MTFKQKIQNLFFPIGSIQKIRRGYLKGYKIRLTENSLWSPIIGNWEPAMQKIMVNIVKEGSVAYDLGANNGLHGLLLAGLVGKSGKVYNFEPFEGNINEIVENFQLNNISNYKNVQAAVSDQNGIAAFGLGHHHKQGAILDVDSNEEKIQVQSITLDSFIESGNPGPSFIKMDIEGAEGSALKGFSENIERYFPDMIIELHSPEQDREVGAFLNFHNYTAYRFDTFKTLSFTKIKNFSEAYPSPDGIWGSILCLGPGKKIENYNWV